MSLLLVALASAVPARGQSCYVPSAPQYYSNLCGTETFGQTYEFEQPLLSFFTSQNGTSYLLACTNSDVGIYDAASPGTLSSPLVTRHIPWDWGTIKNADSHAPMYPHIFDVATLDDAGFPYALVSLGNYGWDFLKLSGASSKFLANGYKPGSVLLSAYVSTAIFQANGNVYVAAQALDSTSIAQQDYSVRIYKIGGGGTTPETISYKTMGQGVTVPIGHAGDLYDNTRFPLALGFRFYVLIDASGHRLLLVKRGSTAAAVVNIDNPTAPQPVELSTQASLVGGKWAVDATRHAIWVGSASQTIVDGYVVDTAGLPVASSFTLPPAYTNIDYDATDGPAVSVLSPGTGVAVSGDLLTAFSIISNAPSYLLGSRIGYISLAGPSPTLLGRETPYTDLDPNHICQNAAYFETIKDARPFQVGGNYYASLSLAVDAMVVGINGSCMSTTPVPKLTVSGGSAGASCGAADGSGFPGDTFTLTNASTGQWSGNPVSLVVTPSVGTLTGPDGQNNYTWVSPADQTGTFTFTLTLNDAAGVPYTTTATINLCGNPEANLQVSAVQAGGQGSFAACGTLANPCAYLTNDALQFSAAPPISEGSPTSFVWSWLEPVSDVSGTTSSFNLSQTGRYTVWVGAQYGFPGAQTSCTSAPATLTQQLGGTNYASCASVQVVSSPFWVSDPTATQSGSAFPNFITSAQISLSASYKLAANYSATFSWTGSKSSVDGSGAATPSSVPASTQTQSGWISGTVSNPTPDTNPQTVTLNASATNGSNTVPFNPTVMFNVTTCAPPGALTNTSPADGETGVDYGSVPLSWTTPSGTGPFMYTVFQPGMPPLIPDKKLCQTTSNTCTVNVSAEVTQRWFVTADSQCGSGTSSSTTTSFTTTSPPPPPSPTPTPTPPPSSRLTITPSPNPASAGQAVAFTFSPRLSQSGDAITFYFGDGSTARLTYAACSVIAGGLACGQTSNTYATTGNFSVTASGNAGGTSVAGSTSVAVTQVCTLPAAPVAAFTYSAATLQAQFSDASAGGPTSWAWNFGDAVGPFPAGASSAQSPLYTFRAAGTYTVTLTATNCKGSSQTSQVVTVSSCNQTAVPAASFTWPTGAVDGFPEQQQPYVGQAVTLTDTSTNSPTSWAWTFGDGGTSSQQNPAHAYVAAQTFTVKLTATNCVGASTEVAQPMTVYPDVRHVVADFTWGSDPLATGAPVTLVAAQGPSYGDPDTFTWTFDDGTAPQTGALASITHTFTCAGPHKVTLTASRSNAAAATAAATHTLTVTGQPQCAPLAVMTVDAAKVNGLNGTSWRTDVRIFNPSAQASKVTLEFVPVNAGSPSGPGTFMTLAPNATWVFDDVLGTALSQGFVGNGVTKAALRATFDNVDNVAPIVISDTYTSPPSGGGRYGELTPGVEVVPNTTPPVLWIAGIRNNGITTGFRTNYSLVNLRSDAGVQNLKFTLFDATGTAIATQTTSMNTLEYRQDSLANLFGGAAAAVSPNPLAVRVDVPTGSDIQAYVSVMDNLTGDPVLIPAVPPPTSPIFLPAVGYTPGLNGTVWRADLQITNPDSTGPHTWEIKYLPRSGTGAFRSVTLAPQATTRMDDLLSWVFNGLLSTDASTSGMVRIAPADGSSVYPIVQARSFNQTPNGTFGQNITPITANMGVAAGQGERLLLTGMSSQDIARTNLGFVNLSDTSSVAFSVMFYDEGGNVLNPKDGQGNPIPYTISLGVGGWDQDLLENRFKNTTGFPALGANLKAISAVIQVTGGGPGTAYATVIDAQTGDPNFILAQPAP